MTNAQKVAVSIALPCLAILAGFEVIGDGGSTVTEFGDDGGVAVTFNPFRYLARNGIEWMVVVGLVAISELFLWRPRGTEKEEQT